MFDCFLLAENRTALRELEGLEKLIDFVGNKDFDDLHVHALQVLTNCMQDPESMQVRKYINYQVLFSKEF